MKIDIEITRIETTKTAVLEHRGPAELVNESVSKFIEWRKTTGLSTVDSSKSFGIAYDDPEATPPAKFRFDICGEVKEIVVENDYGIINKVMPSGRCAKHRHIGSYDQLDDKVRYLYSTWLPESGEMRRDFPVFFEYMNLGQEVPVAELITDIYMLLD